MLTLLTLGLVGSALIGFVAYWRKSLSRSGVLATVIVGTAIFAFGGSAWWILLIAFFVSSSALSHFRKTQKAAIAKEFSKGSRRDIGQVFANGGLGALIAAVYTLVPAPWLWAAFAGTMATVTADTWATELGVLNPKPPRLVTTGRPVETGTSGGVTVGGTGAALAGAAIIGLLAGVFLLGQSGVREAGVLFLAASVGGFVGSLFDSLLGATVQQIYFCDHCQKETERTLHRCGNETQQLRGWRWLDNDGVNFLSSVTGAVIAAGIWGMIP
jgi:uncharacterized protein (TIGR00297 family)